MFDVTSVISFTAEWLLGAAFVTRAQPRPFIPTFSLKRRRSWRKPRRISPKQCNAVAASGLVEDEPDILLAWAQWHRAKGNAQEAQTYAEEALAIADRCEYRLKQAEIHNFFAQSRWTRAIARRRAKKQKSPKSARGVSPPHCYKTALDKAGENLKVRSMKSEV